MSRRAGAVLLAVVALLLAAGPASADDDYEIDVRLQEAGFAEARTGYVTGGPDDARGVRVSVGYRTGSASAEELAEETRRAAALVWEHLEMRVLAIDVVPTSGVTWLDGQLPPATSLNRQQLEQALGPRPAGLDAGGAGWYDDGDAVWALGALAVGLAVLAAGGVAGFFLGRSSGRRSAATGPWGTPQWGPPQWGPPQWGSPQWGAPAGWPQAGAPAASSSSDPWRPA